MTVLQTIQEHVEHFSPEKQAEVLDFVLFVEQRLKSLEKSRSDEVQGDDKTSFHTGTALQQSALAENLAGELLAIGRHCAASPLLDKRTPEQILGYNAQGLPE